MLRMKTSTATLLLSLPLVTFGSAPNIIFLFPDDLGYGDVSYTDSSIIISPNIELLAAEGIKLRNQYTAHWCGPSRGIIS